MEQSSKKVKLGQLEAAIGERPTVKSNPSLVALDLKDYAFKRSQIELARIEYLQELPDQESEEYQEEHREPLAITEQRTVTIELSTGGDADGFKFTYDHIADELVSGVYYWADWGVYEEAALSLDEAQMVADFYGIYPE